MDRRVFIEYFLKGSGCAVATALGPWVPTARGERRGLAPGVHFLEGVASGDPTVDSVILWTRAEPVVAGTETVALRCEVSEHEDFRTLVVEQAVDAQAASDYTVRVFVQGLEPGRVYWYRFRSGSAVSRVGRTLTAPDADSTAPVKIAWASCQSYEGGYYGIYRTLLEADRKAAPEDKIALVLHLGDFIYEKLGYGSAKGVIRAVPPFPDGGAMTESGEGPYAETVADYRHLYKTYLRDPDLQAARAWWPFVVTWDDHEFTNDCWQSATTYSDNNVPTQPRKVAANQAWFEYIPARLSDGGSDPLNTAHDFKPVQVTAGPLDALDADGLSHNADNLAALGSLTIYRRLRWGKLIDLLITDTRSYRSDHCIPEVLNRQISGTGLYMSPLPIVRQLDAGRTANGGQPLETLQLGAVAVPNPRKTAGRGSMLGARQKAWFKQALRESEAIWKCWMNSVPLMPMRLDMENVRPDGVPTVFTIDTWEGYAMERQELLDYVASEGIENLVSLVGDHHNNFAGVLYQDFDAPEPKMLGAEFAVCGISSMSVWHALNSFVGEEEPFRPLVAFKHGGETHNTLNCTFLHGTKAAAAAAQVGAENGLGAAEAAARQLRNRQHNRHLRYVDSAAYGIGVAQFTATAVRAELITTAIPETAEPEILRRAKFQLAAGANELAAPQIEGTAPLLGVAL